MGWISTFLKKRNKQYIACSKNIVFYLCVYVHLLNREIKYISFCESQPNKLRNMDLEASQNAESWVPHLTQQTGANVAWNLQVLRDFYAHSNWEPPLKTTWNHWRMKSSEMIHFGFRRIFWMNVYNLLGGWSRIEAGTQFRDYQQWIRLKMIKAYILKLVVRRMEKMHWEMVRVGKQDSFSGLVKGSWREVLEEKVRKLCWSYM